MIRARDESREQHCVIFLEIISKVTDTYRIAGTVVIDVGVLGSVGLVQVRGVSNCVVDARSISEILEEESEIARL